MPERFLGLNVADDPAKMEDGFFSTCENVDFWKEGAVSIRDGLARGVHSGTTGFGIGEIRSIIAVRRPEVNAFLCAKSSGTLAYARHPDVEYDESSHEH